MVTWMRPAWVAGPVNLLTVLTCIGRGHLFDEGKGMLKSKIAELTC